MTPSMRTFHGGIPSILIPPSLYEGTPVYPFTLPVSKGSVVLTGPSGQGPRYLPSDIDQVWTEILGEGV